MIIENIWFNAEHWATKTEAEFLAHEAHHGLSTEKMKEVFAVMKKNPEENPSEETEIGTVEEK